MKNWKRYWKKLFSDGETTYQIVNKQIILAPKSLQETPESSDSGGIQNRKQEKIPTGTPMKVVRGKITDEKRNRQCPGPSIVS